MPEKLKIELIVCFTGYKQGDGNKTWDTFDVTTTLPEIELKEDKLLELLLDQHSSIIADDGGIAYVGIYHIEVADEPERDPFLDGIMKKLPR